MNGSGGLYNRQALIHPTIEDIFNFDYPEPPPLPQLLPTERHSFPGVSDEPQVIDTEPVTKEQISNEVMDIFMSGFANPIDSQTPPHFAQYTPPAKKEKHQKVQRPKTVKVVIAVAAAAVGLAIIVQFLSSAGIVDFSEYAEITEKLFGNIFG
jgi:hypothetical protein